MGKIYPLQALAIAVISGTPFLAALFVALRVYARKRAGIALGWDDYLVVIATVLSIGVIWPSVQIVYMWHRGIHIWDVNQRQLEPDYDEYAVVQLVFNALNTPIMPLVKCSILILLLKVSRVLVWIRRTIKVLLFIVILSAVGPWFALLFLCPVRTGGTVAPTVFGNLPCIAREPGGILNIAQLAFNIFTDLLIFPIPILLMSNLKNTSLRSRLAVIFSFALSMGATIIGAIRLQQTYKVQIYHYGPGDWTFDISFCLNNAENNAAIVLACMSPLRSLVMGWTRRSGDETRRPGQSTVLNQRIPGESLLFRSLVQHEDPGNLFHERHNKPEALGDVARLSTINEERNNSEATFFRRPSASTCKTPTSTMRSLSSTTDSLKRIEVDEITVAKGEKS